jgi:Fic family protein
MFAARSAVNMPAYTHERPQWPTFRWDEKDLSHSLADVRHRQGLLTGHMRALGFDLRAEAVLATLTEDVLKSSEIEGEVLNREQVRSSIARRLGMDIGALSSADRNVEGVVGMMLDATQKYSEPLNEERLFGWHASLFPTGHSGMQKIIVGAWRDQKSGPMQVISGAFGREKVHYEAPSFDRLAADMSAFLTWFDDASDIDPVLKAALAHLWFVTIHPFDDGNGRIARAIADMALARSEQSPQRFYSMSAQIRLERNAYYDILEETQKGDLDVTAWLKWFLVCLGRAINGAEDILSNVLRKARFWDTIKDHPLNERQRKVINLLLEKSEVKLTNAKWTKLTGASSDTSLRDITDLVRRGVLVRDQGGGRSTSYALVGG